MKGARKKLPVKKYLLLGVEVLALVVATVAVFYVASFFVLNIMLALGLDPVNDTVTSAVYSLLSYVIIFLLIVLLPRLLQQKDKRPRLSKELGFNNWPTWTDIALAPLGYVATIMVSYVLTLILAVFDQTKANEEQLVNLADATIVMGWEKILSVLVLVIAAPIIEEIVFRGWLYGKLRKTLKHDTPRWLNLIISIVLTSAAFGIIHRQLNLFIFTFVMSTVSCLMRELTNSINAGILLHMLSNAIALYSRFTLGA